MNKFDEIKEAVENQLSPILSPVKGKVLDRWDELNNRDQLIVTVLAVCLVVVFVIVVIYAPMLTMREDSRMQYESKLKQYTWMSSIAPQVEGAKPSGSPTVRNLMEAINTKASAFQLQLGRVQPEGSNKLRVSIQNAPFDAIMRWLSELNAQGVLVNTISIDAESDPGIVTAKILLQGS